MGEKRELGKYEWNIANLNSGWFYWLQSNLVLLLISRVIQRIVTIVTAGGPWLVKLLFCFMYALETRHRQTLKVEPVENRQCIIERYAYLKKIIYFVLRSFRASTRTSVLWCQNACQVRKMRTCWQVCIYSIARFTLAISGRFYIYLCFEEIIFYFSNYEGFGECTDCRVQYLQ